MKRDPPIKIVSTVLEVFHFLAPVEHPVRPNCLNCSLPLSLSQPDINAPERLLGVCEQCKRWFLIDVLRDMPEGFLFRLPDARVIRQLSVEQAAARTTKANESST
jgi:hypothetical protein